MPHFGAHLSTSGGLHQAMARAAALGCAAAQIFAKNASQWAARPLTAEQTARFREARAGSGVRCLAVHDSYLIKLASPDDALYDRSVGAFVAEMERAEALGAEFLVTHPGAHTGSGEAAGLARVVGGYEEAHRRCPGFRVRVLVETTAGQGTVLGHRFEHLAAILSGAGCGDRMGVCFDTCHVFAAGYDLGTGDGYRSTFEEFDERVGLARLMLFHVNDSVGARGSRVDRHAGIGAGAIGAEAFGRLVTDPRFREHPMILETPKAGDDGSDLDPVNLRRLREMAGATGRPLLHDIV